MLLVSSLVILLVGCNKSKIGDNIAEVSADVVSDNVVMGEEALSDDISVSESTTYNENTMSASIRKVELCNQKEVEEILYINEEFAK